MKRYILKRVGYALISLVLLSVTIFLFVRVTGDPAVLLVEPGANQADIDAIRTQFGLDRPLWVQYGHFAVSLLRGDLGHSFYYRMPVLELYLSRLPNSLLLAAAAMAFSLVIGIPTGIIAAVRVNRWWDSAGKVFALLGLSLPSFWVGLLLILFFSVTFEQHGWPWLPSSGATSPLGGGDILDRLEHLILPATVLSFFYLSLWSRFTRSSMLEVLSQDYIRTARAKGMGERRVVYLHGLRNALIPLITLVGLELPGLVSGGLVVEVVFGWPGIGRLLFERALQYDYSTVMGVTFFATLLVIAGNLLADVLYAVLDPRIRYA